ncbi:uncharacterized protein [Diabrotica undecimpunctata]|uniref:uncharacterized protein n=1 Tax=Diabrotica undecimpunctata TaxID=50387 RepID=UPI003B63D559
MSTLIQRRLAEATTNIMGQYQCGFIRGKSTTDAIHTVKQIMEKAYGYKIEVELPFIEFQQAFDSINIAKLLTAMREMRIHNKLRPLIKMTMSKTVVTVKTQEGDTEEFVINKGVRQGDS